MNLSTDEYLNLLDQVSLLKIQNQRYQQDNLTLATQIQKQRIYRYQQSRELAAGYGSNRFREYPKDRYYGYDSLYPMHRNVNDYMDEFKYEINSVGKNICHYINMSVGDQIKYLRQQIIKLRDQSKQGIEKKKNIEENVFKSKENISNISNFSSMRNNLATQSRLKQNNKLVSNKSLTNMKTQSNQTYKTMNGQGKQFYQKIKFLYSLYNKENKQPTYEELYTWINQINYKNYLNFSTQQPHIKVKEEPTQNGFLRTETCQKSFLNKSHLKSKSQSQCQSKAGSKQKIKSNKSIRNYHEDTQSQISVIKQPSIAPNKKFENTKLKKKGLAKNRNIGRKEQQERKETSQIMGCSRSKEKPTSINKCTSAKKQPRKSNQCRCQNSSLLYSKTGCLIPQSKEIWKGQECCCYSRKMARKLNK